MRSNSGKRSRRSEKEQPVSSPYDRSNGFKEVKPLNYAQSQYIDAIRRSEIIFGIGSAGTGKTFIAAMFAASELFHRKVDKIIITRPNVEVGKGLGFLKGDLEEKYAPYLAPFEDIFIKYLGKGFYEYAINKKEIDPKPLAFMRGATFENAIVLADEMQNATKEELQMLLSRIGDNCKVIISGDPDQADISNSGLTDAVTRLDRIKGIEIVRFLDDDIVRSKMCKQIIMAYRK